MNKFLFKSTAADLSKILPILETIQKNVLYSTHIQDKISSRLSELELIMSKYLTNQNLQKQVDQYFEDDETSPQTDPDEQKDQD